MPVWVSCWPWQRSWGSVHWQHNLRNTVSTGAQPLIWNRSALPHAFCVFQPYPTTHNDTSAWSPFWVHAAGHTPPVRTSALTPAGAILAVLGCSCKWTQRPPPEAPKHSAQVLSTKLCKRPANRIALRAARRSVRNLARRSFNSAGAKFCFHCAMFVRWSLLCRRQQGLVSSTTRSGAVSCITRGSHVSSRVLSAAESRSSHTVVAAPLTTVGTSCVFGFTADALLTRKTQLPSRAATLLNWDRWSAHTSTYKTASPFSCAYS